jgi:hypothetical protein
MSLLLSITNMSSSLTASNDTRYTVASKDIATIFLSNKISATLIIPIEIARRHGLNEPSHVVIEETTEGILIKKLEF